MTAPLRVIGQWLVIDRDAVRTAEPIPVTDCPDELRPILGAGTLTERQLQVLDGLARGETAEQTAHRLVMAHGTVKTHQVNLYKILGARSGPHAVAIAFRTGILT